MNGLSIGHNQFSLNRYMFIYIYIFNLTTLIILSEKKLCSCDLNLRQQASEASMLTLCCAALLPLALIVWIVCYSILLGVRPSGAKRLKNLCSEKSVWSSMIKKVSRDRSSMFDPKIDIILYRGGAVESPRTNKTSYSADLVSVLLNSMVRFAGNIMEIFG